MSGDDSFMHWLYRVALTLVVFGSVVGAGVAIGRQLYFARQASIAERDRLAAEEAERKRIELANQLARQQEAERAARQKDAKLTANIDDPISPTRMERLDRKAEEFAGMPPGQPHEIRVRSTLVRYVGGGPLERLLTDGVHRYYFDIRNSDRRPFNGTVSITLHDVVNKTETFSTSSGLEPGLGSFVFVEATTAPGSPGKRGITQFSFTATSEGRIVATGTGAITPDVVDEKGNRIIPAPAPAPVPTPAPAPVARPAEQLENTGIVVGHMSTKFVDGLHRYFFRVKNDGQGDLTGTELQIKIGTHVGRLGNGSNSWTLKMAPGQGSFGYVEARTGPPSVHAEYGLTIFEWTLKRKGTVIDKGTGRLKDGVIE